MGAYLSSPVTDKISSDKRCTAFTYGASSMQGWRISQEDAHNCIPDLDTKTAMFAVYDGHGGAEVAQYCSKFLPQCIKETDQYKEGELGPALVDAFLKFDSTLVQDDVIKELKLLAGCDENEEEDDDEDPVGRGEADDLRAEADLPLDELLAKYQSPPALTARNLRKKENLQSPVVRSKQSQAGGSAEAGPCASTDVAAGSSSYAGASNSSSVGLTNGLADNENNLNKEKELKDSVRSHPTEQKVDNAGDSSYANSSSTDSSAGCAGSRDGGQSVVSVADSSSGAGDAGSSGIGCGSSSAGDSSCGGSSGSSSVQGKSSDQASGGVSSSASCAENESPSGSGTGGSSKAGGSGSKGEKNGPKKGESMNEEDEDSGSDEDDEDEWEDLSWDEDEEEEEEEEEEEMDGADEPIMDMSNEEPGSDSGCTACVALLRGDCLVVANAGDSRCVLCRGGKAVDLSVDHKPEDDTEKDRIEKAGGKVTADGRVNGGLNLSRALGDHFYKRKEGLPPEEQMITALPDIQLVQIDPEDEFIVLACDGIWNSMSSQQCVDFVAERIKDPVKRNKPSIICEEMFDHCLAANTYGDGTGCDNMTCIIVVLNQLDQSEVDDNTHIPTKRSVLDVETPEDNTEKRPRVEEGEGSMSG